MSEWRGRVMSRGCEEIDGSINEDEGAILERTLLLLCILIGL
jgi:hypothetical protein